MKKNIQTWGDAEHKACYDALSDLMKNGPLTFEHVENVMIVVTGADLAFEICKKHIPSDLPAEASDVILKAMRYAEYRQFTNLTKL